ncbi:hypothetical protein SH528x_003884 [Novipirellula sp. SH528]|uniref:hypothetical protein n=1 Tax=Novipirellula sp. SH528 TaxID=3454466 RepID=UPI003FA04804
MLLLPLLLLWARTPMYFSRYLMAGLIPTTTLIAVLTPLFVFTIDGNASAADRFGDDSQQAVAGQNRSDFDGLSTLATRHGDALGSDTRNPGLGQANSLRQQLREGTIMPQITGQISMSGRRWVFTPIAEKQIDNNSPANRLRKIESRTRQTVNAGSTSRTFETSLEVYEQATPAKNARSEPKSIEILENLVLQRVVNAIRADANDNQWTITARATEFFDENRLILLTAQRSGK